jgi:hypothetical protein
MTKETPAFYETFAHWRHVSLSLLLNARQAATVGKMHQAKAMARLSFLAWRRAERLRLSDSAATFGRMEQKQSAASRIAKAIAKGIADGIPPFAVVRAALKDPNLPKFPRIVASLATVAALVVAVWKFASGALTLPELVQLIQAALSGQHISP